jgi:microcystin-dependent protein
MSSPFLAEIRCFGCNFPPTGWAFCDGQLMAISQNTALFSLLGTNYGGDGKSTFALPNLQGSVALGWGQGPGLSQYSVGESTGTDIVTLLQSEMPAHNHTVQSSAGGGQVSAASNNEPGKVVDSGNPVNVYNSTPTSGIQMSVQSVGITGQSLPHNNVMPYLVLNFCIALQGVFPPRS